MGTVYFPYLRNLVAVGCCIFVYREWPRRKILSFIRTSLTWQWVLRLLMPNLICFRVRTSASVLSLSFLLTVFHPMINVCLFSHVGLGDALRAFADSKSPVGLTTSEKLPRDYVQESFDSASQWYLNGHSTKKPLLTIDWSSYRFYGSLVSRYQIITWPTLPYTVTLIPSFYDGFNLRGHVFPFRVSLRFFVIHRAKTCSIWTNVSCYSVDLQCVIDPR